MGSAQTRVRRQGRQLTVAIAVACAIVPVFNVVSSEASVQSAIQGLVDAVLISLLVGGYLLFVRDGWARAWFREIGFWADLTLSSTLVLVLFLAGRAFGQVVTSLDPGRFVTSLTERHLLYALPFFAILALTIQFVIQLNRMIGANVLRYFIGGVYHRPTSEERIFLFLDLEGSTHLAERLGSTRYFELLRRCVDDLTEPVLETEGEIYQYAGDEVVVTWRVEDGIRAANCLRCFFKVRQAITHRADRYERDFGAVPRFRGGLHGGTVTAGEIGDLRKQIVFVGDILNTAARLEEHAKRTGVDLVASQVVLERMELPSGFETTRCGELALRGKDSRVIAYNLKASGFTAGL
jgi:class 3 adenylate cyclase